MVVAVLTTESPERILEDAGAFLRSEPVRHNVILTLLQVRIARPEPGRYWAIHRDGQAAGVVFQSPTHFFATITPMGPEAVTAVVDAIVDQGVDLPGVHGEAGTAARFAGHWAERTHSAARPVQGQRLYEVEDVTAGPSCSSQALHPPPGESGTPRP